MVARPELHHHAQPADTVASPCPALTTLLQALRRNPFAPTVPCHRVIAASLELGGFSGGWGLGCDSVHKKRRLLQEEGVHFDERGRLLASDAGAVMTAAELRAAAKAVL